jgi:outer membrane protein assembly factor BamB
MKNANRATRVLVGGVVLLGATCIQAADWPQWRGPNRDNKVAGFTEPPTWPKELTKKWSVKVGVGDAGPVLVGDKVYTFTREGANEVIRCLEADTGKEVWQEKYAAKAVTGAAQGHPGPRCTPVAGDGKICALGVDGNLSCLDGASGKVVWRKATGAVPSFFTSSSPLILEGKCIACIGSGRTGGIVAYDLNTGEEKWKWTGEGAAYGSPVLMKVGETRTVVTLMASSLVGVNAADGSLLWKTAYKSQYNSETPVIDKQTVIISGPGEAVAYKIEKTADTFAANQVWKKNYPTSMYDTPVLRDGLLYGLAARTPRGQGPTRIYCADAQTGAVLWTDEAARGECGEIIDAGNVLLALTSDSTFLVFKPSKEKYEQLASYKVADSKTWAPPVLTDKRLFVKDQDSLTLWTIE